MEIGLPGGTATLFVLRDGTTSLYTSTGGGVVGGHAHQNVRKANAEFIATANRLQQYYQPTANCPVPAAGQVVFYALTDSGPLTAGGSEEALGKGHHPLSPLFFAGHGVLTQLRLTSPDPNSGF